MGGSFPSTDDELRRFERAQAAVFAQVERELRDGAKRSHWRWFVFPQLLGLGGSEMARRYGIRSLDEACAYLEHPVLGGRLRDCTRLVNAVPGRDPGRSIERILGYPDDLKFRSCMTLFAAADPAEPLFREALDLFFEGRADPLTVELLARGRQAGS